MSATQPFLIAEGPWVEIRDGDLSAVALYRRHYSYRPRRSGRKINLIVGPGYKLVLLTPDATALFVWRKHRATNGQSGVECAVFRNEGRALSSDLIRAADAIADRRWPGERHYTYVDASKTSRRRSRRSPAGACFVHAGWRRCGLTLRGLQILERISA